MELHRNVVVELGELVEDKSERLFHVPVADGMFAVFVAESVVGTSLLTAGGGLGE